MDIFGIGPLELLLVLLLALLIFGPKDIEKAGRTVGRSLYNLLHSETWQAVTQASRKIRVLPTELVKKAEQEILQEKVERGETRGEEWLKDPHIPARISHPSEAARRKPAAGSKPPKKPARKPAGGSPSGASKKPVGGASRSAPRKDSSPKSRPASRAGGSEKRSKPKQPRGSGHA